MSADSFRQMAARYPALRIAVAGDFCLDRYLEIDPARAETSIETGLPVRNVVRVRAQPGAAGTVLNNLAALGVGEIHAVGFCGEDGEGYELRGALERIAGVCMDGFLVTPQRRTFTYCKPLIVVPGAPPIEMERLDTKNWTPTPEAVQAMLAAHVRRLGAAVDAVILMDQVDAPETGVVTRHVREAAAAAQRAHPGLLVLADTRRSLDDYPPMTFKMNGAELGALCGQEEPPDVVKTMRLATALARRNGHPVFVTLSEHGIVGAGADGYTHHVPGLPLRGPIDIVGAGDAVTANLAAALAAGADRSEAMTVAMAAASVVIHKLGTTGTASPHEIETALA